MAETPDLTKIPSGPPPLGVIPNFINPPDSQQSTVIAVAGLCLALTTIFTVLRLTAKRSLGNFKLEDYLLVSSWMLFVAYCAIIIAQANGGVGRNIWDVPAINGIYVLQLGWAIEMLYCVLMFTAKATLIFQMRSIFATQRSGVVSIASTVLLWANFFCYLASLIALLAECVPTVKIWSPLLPTGHCINLNALLVSTGAINIVSDITILALPLWVIWNLQINKQTKISILAIFSSGSISVVSAIGRFVYTIFTLTDSNSTMVFAKIAMWSLAEFTTIILCTCLPFMPKIFQMFRDRQWHSRPGYIQQSDTERSKNISLGNRSSRTNPDSQVLNDTT